MTKEEVMALLATAEDDIEYDDCGDKIYADVNDFEGFDKDWNEIYRKYDKEKVTEIFQTLKKNCNRYDDDFYDEFQFDGFKVVWGYTSYDI